MSFPRQISMAKWSTISGRFSEDEVELIKKWQKKIRLSDNQMVRAGVELMVGFAAMSELLTSKDFVPVQSLVKEIQKSMESPAVKQEFEKIGEKWLSKLKEEKLKDFEIKVKELGDEFKVFEKRDKRGRKPTKKKRKSTS